MRPPKVFLLETGDRFVAKALLVPVALAERDGDPVHDVFVDRDAPEHGRAWRGKSPQLCWPAAQESPETIE